MTAMSVLTELTRAGVSVRLTGQGLAFAPRLDESLRALVTLHKADLVQALDPEVAWRVVVMRAQVTNAAALPFLVARPSNDAQTGNACVSCGDALPEAPRLGPGRCRSCLRSNLTQCVQSRDLTHPTWMGGQTCSRSG